MTDADSSEIVDLADRVELGVIRSRRRRLSWSRVVETVAAAHGDDDAETVDELGASVRTELRRRSTVPGYPFDVADGAVAAAGTDADVALWEFMVTMSAYKQTRLLPGTGLKPTLLFERVSRAALETYTGGGEAHLLSDLHPKIRGAIAELGDRLNVEAHPHRARKERKDHGLDVVAWHPFRNLRHGHPTVLCQCTVGRAGSLVAKARETTASEWGTLLAVTEASLVTALAVPHVLPNDWAHWTELTCNTELVLDRLRLWELLDPTQRAELGASGPLGDVLEGMRAAAA